MDHSDSSSNTSRAACFAEIITAAGPNHSHGWQAHHCCRCQLRSCLTSSSLLQVPTTVMATVDSSVGGKTGVNHPLGKNMIGAFYQPQCVLIDTDTLKTLPDRELASGISEIVKYGLIRDEPLFVWLEQNMDRLLQRDPEVTALSLFFQQLCHLITSVARQKCICCVSKAALLAGTHHCSASSSPSCFRTQFPMSCGATCYIASPLRAYCTCATISSCLEHGVRWQQASSAVYS